jgi:dihydrofolate reductase
MGRLIVSTHVTLDGVIGPSPDEWALLDGEHERHSFDQLLAADAFVLGRPTFEGLASVWPDITDDTGFADRVNALPKHVASRTLTGPLGWNGTLIEGDLAAGVARLKAGHRGNLLTYGCGELAHELVTLGLVDEVHLWVQPVVWGEGERLFGGRRVRLDLLASTTFSSGVVLQTYRPRP